MANKVDKENLAYKLTSDIFKHYDIKDLEEKYKLTGGKLIVSIYNEIFSEIKSENDTPTVVFTGEDELLN